MTMDEEFDKWFEREQFKNPDLELDKDLAYAAWSHCLHVFNDRVNDMFNKKLATETGE